MSDTKKNKAELLEELASSRVRITELEQRISEQMRIENELRKSEQRYKTLVHTSPDAVTVTNIEGTITYVSPQTLRLYGFDDEEELLGTKFFDLIAPESKAAAIIYLNMTLKEGFTKNLEYTLLKKNRARFIGEISSAVIRDTEGHPKEFISATRDITERKHADLRLKTSIKEKELLLQEIHHRVKNNLQVISSILDLSRMRLHDPQARELIEDARSKIQTMAFIHSQLYRSDRFDHIEMGAHIRQLINYLTEVYSGKKTIHAHLEISPVYLSLTLAIPCALVLNELISNAFKHAFRECREGTIEVTMHRRQGNMIFIGVKDDGVGLQDEIDIHTSERLGLKLVRNLVEKQLRGTISVKQEGYTEFLIRFPAREEEVEHA